MRSAISSRSKPNSLHWDELCNGRAHLEQRSTPVFFLALLCDTMNEISLRSGVEEARKVWLLSLDQNGSSRIIDFSATKPLHQVGVANMLCAARPDRRPTLKRLVDRGQGG